MQNNPRSKAGQAENPMPNVPIIKHDPPSSSPRVLQSTFPSDIPGTNNTSPHLPESHHRGGILQQRRNGGLSQSRQPKASYQHSNGAPPQLTPSRSSVKKRPSNSSSQFVPSRPLTQELPKWVQGPAVKLFVDGLPPEWGIDEIESHFAQYSVVHRIDVQEPLRHDITNCTIVLKPPPTRLDWIRNGIDMQTQHRKTPYHVTFKLSPIEAYYHASPLDSKRKFAEEIELAPVQLAFGVMKAKGTMLVLHTLDSPMSTPLGLVLNVRRKELDITFAIRRDPFPLTNERKITRPCLFKLRLNFAQIKKVVKIKDDNARQVALVLSTDTPPSVFRKAQSVAATHEKGATKWNEWQAWYRQTGIVRDPSTACDIPTQLQKEAPIIDIGRWLTYRLIFLKDTAELKSFAEVYDALYHHNIETIDNTDLNFSINQDKQLWTWLDQPSKDSNDVPNSYVLSSDLLALTPQTVHLPFQVRYQLEVCISQGLLHECNITRAFLEKLAKITDPQRATRLLEKVADEKSRFFCPEDIFRRLLHKVTYENKRVPSYCALIRAATVTPTTVYFRSPVLEASNSIIRRHQEHQDRFLRVKFTDEQHIGKIQSSDNNVINEVFTRVKRTMTNGINVGGRHYEFLALGSSQFREGGAYFFASGNGLTVQEIRRRIGNFQDIKIVAKYCARIGQSFSTTRATPYGVSVDHIPDIERNNYCFTDGVGKISIFLAQLIAQEHGLPNPTTDYPSVFQFRMGGCKGVLAVDPSLRTNKIQIRPSQMKFVAVEDRPGLNICRISQFSTAYLNVQTILVLSALGVDDHVFIVKMRHMLSDLAQAMSDENKAIELLQKNIDFNQMTLQLSSMILDGFMTTKDPFTTSCLHLWRSWTIKYLKEKARICVEHGAFVLGCVDETATLKGHVNGTESENEDEDEQDVELLPEIFLQIPDPGKKSQWKVIEESCMLWIYRNSITLRNCVVFPQNGDRDIPNMCSGGDLDGDDYMVTWDPELIPRQWNYPAMNYQADPPRIAKGPVTVNDMTSFFVTYMKNDNLGRIAVAHKCWADFKADGVKDPHCLKLAQLHSKAVDYVKTGDKAIMDDHLKKFSRPHWTEPRPGQQQHKSHKVLGKLYDMVERVNFVPAWYSPFDKRVLDAFELNEEILEAAREAKQEYDASMRRIMAQFSIRSEIEVWSTFVLNHCDDMGDYKFAEKIGEAVNALKDQHQKMCYEKAGTSDKERDYSKLGPFVAAMYAVTAEGMMVSVEECKKTKLVRGRWIPNKEPTVENMPFMSFPWLFPAELGRIAKGRGVSYGHALQSRGTPKKHGTENVNTNISTEPSTLPPLPEVEISSPPVREETSVDLTNSEVDLEGLREHSGQLIELPSGIQSTEVVNSDPSDGTEQVGRSDASNLIPSNANQQTAPDAQSVRRFNLGAVVDVDAATGASATGAEAMGEDNMDEDDDEVEEVMIKLEPSPFDALDKLMAS